MTENEHRLDRRALYELVWSTPMAQLADQYAISDVGLAKLCKRLNVPRPGRGYWARVQAGNCDREPRSRRRPIPIASVPIWV